MMRNEQTFQKEMVTEESKNDKSMHERTEQLIRKLKSSMKKTSPIKKTK